ncbi:hypothetical protein COCON_G00129960 [Conger conger]|uniref:VWFA domain-containing protein n=1 Tax=Conger conger TaxID=82655 RepID=A0A9Q1DDM5_CONCO|nr:hypothetical protein COCON_G00129960 [Conger conger]
MPSRSYVTPKTRSNPENNVGLITMAKSNCEVLTTLTPDTGRILSKLHAVQPRGMICFCTGIRVAHLVKMAKRLKKEKVNVDVINIGEEPGRRPAVLPHPGREGGSMLGLGASDLEFGSGPSADPELVLRPEFGVDPSADPELVLALRVSMEEQRQRQEEEARRVAAASAAEAGIPTPTGDGEGEGAPTPRTDGWTDRRTDHPGREGGSMLGLGASDPSLGWTPEQ